MNSAEREKIFINGKIFQLIKGDITEEETDTIVNAADSNSVHGGGPVRL